MASIETLQKRIDGKEKAIEKLYKKLERIKKAEASNWENNPYYYGPSDLISVQKDIESEEEILAKYKQDLIMETEKAGSRNIEVIWEFLRMWKSRVFDFYNEGFLLYYQEKENVSNLYSKYSSLGWSASADRDIAKTNYEIAYENLHNKLYGYFKIDPNKPRWNNKVKVKAGEYEYIRSYVEGRTLEEAQERLNKDLDQEMVRKYDFIVDRANKITGTFIDASGLYIGMNGELNGIIIGDRGKAAIETIGAGGYNIQCYHFRTLVKPFK